MSLRRAASLIRKTIIVALTLAAVGTGVGWMRSRAACKSDDFAQRLLRFPKDGVTVGSVCGLLDVTYEYPAARRKALPGVWGSVQEWWQYRRAPDLPESILPFKDGPNRQHTLAGIHWSAWKWPTLHCFSVAVPLWMLATIFATYPTIAFIRGPLRRHRRRKRGLCIHCGYDLRGTTGGVCSECGVEVVKP